MGTTVAHIRQYARLDGASICAVVGGFGGERGSVGGTGVRMLTRRMWLRMCSVACLTSFLWSTERVHGA
jgi:hypothetical protein